jgi:sugar/nucleoside kinase (ribokinase family)/D-arabinose 5-phosphate isomerase GutQ
MSASKRKLDVVGIGSMAVDRVHRVPRILGADEKGMMHSIEGEGPVRDYVGGVLLNQMGWAALFGLEVGLTGRQGDDERGRFLRQEMERSGIDHHILLDGSASTIAEIFIDDDGERAIYMAPGATEETRPEHIRTDHAEYIRRGARFSTEVSQVPLDTVLEALTVAREAGIPTVVDLDVPPSAAVPTLGEQSTLYAVLEGASLLKPSKSAASELLANGESDPLKMASALRLRFGNDAVVLTDGRAGCAIAASDFEGVVAGHEVNVLDTTGAGDAFLGGLLAALHHGLGWQDAGRLANACGAACTEQMGAFPSDPTAARARVLELYGGPKLSLPAFSHAPAEPAVVNAGQTVMDVTAAELTALARRYNSAALEAATALILAAQKAGGRVHVTGIGKPGHVAHYGASILSSTGTAATFLHATEAIHGSLGQVEPGDVVIAISNSGGTAELLQTVDALLGYGARLIGVVGNPASELAQKSDVMLDAGVSREGGPLELAPRASVAAEIMVLAALSAQLQAARDLSREEYGRRHPAGELGRRARKQ